METKAQAALEVEEKDGSRVLRPVGAWTVATAGDLFSDIQSQSGKAGGKDTVVIDCGDLESLDTAGAWLIYRLGRDLEAAGGSLDFQNTTTDQQALLDEVAANDAPCTIEPPRQAGHRTIVEDIGRGTVELYHSMRSLTGFLGLVTVTLGHVLRKPSRIRWTPLVFHMEAIGVKAMPIVGLMAFLIGIVIAQQGEFQLSQFGASLFVVNLLGISILREIAILITAIMVAGRTGSAFAAELGTMMLNEEVDAMRTFGIDPIESLVIPRLLAIVIMMPLLTFYADVIALVGGGMFCWFALDIPPAIFLDRLNDSIDLNNFMVGMIKAPFFGLMIAIAGCYEGLQTKGGAEAVGRQTTRAVVESIFLVIVLDAAFAIFFSAIGM